MNQTCSLNPKTMEPFCEILGEFIFRSFFIQSLLHQRLYRCFLCKIARKGPRDLCSTLKCCIMWTVKSGLKLKSNATLSFSVVRVHGVGPYVQSRGSGILIFSAKVGSIVTIEFLMFMNSFLCIFLLFIYTCDFVQGQGQAHRQGSKCKLAYA